MSEHKSVRKAIKKGLLWRIGVGCDDIPLPCVRSVSEPPERWFNMQSVKDAEELCQFLNEIEVKPL